MDNQAIAWILQDYARFLESQHENLYRIRAYRRAAETVLRQQLPISDMVHSSGSKRLRLLPRIGSHLSHTIEEIVRTGHLPQQLAKRQTKAVKELGKQPGRTESFFRAIPRRRAAKQLDTLWHN